jgi:PAS domain S-box-containing protein
MGGALMVLLAAVFVLVGKQLIRSETSRHEQLRREEVLESLLDMRESLSSRIYLNIYKISAVSSLVAMNPDLTQEDFARAIEVQFRGDHDLRNIAVARGTVISYVYPIEGNQAIIGMDYSKVPDQFEAVSRAINLNEIVLAGPVALVQGGEGIIARTPIRIVNQATGEEEYWGISSSVMNIESLFEGGNMNSERDGLRIAIRGKDALGSAGEVFFGDASVFDSNPLLQTIELPHGSWKLAAVPVGGWEANTVFFTPMLWAYYFISLAVLMFTAIILRLTATRRQAQDALIAAEDLLKKTAYDLTESIPVGTYTMVQPPEGGLAMFKFMSRRFLELAGLTRELAEDPLKVFDAIHPEDYDEWIAKNVQAFTEKKPFFGETRVILNGELRWVQAESTPRSLPDGTTVWEGVLIDITEQKQLEEQLISEKEKAEAATLAKSQFLANMSHEIRTPLNGLIGFTDLLKNTPLTPEQQQYVNNANVSGHTLLGIISDILDFSKIEAGMLELEVHKTDLFTLMEDSIDVVRFIAEQKGLELLLNISEDAPRYAHVDPVRLKQVLANLLSNAVKFTESGEVELKLVTDYLDGNMARLSFSVRDTGIGISESQYEKLFSAFSQADTSTTRKFGGTGLGLSISEMIANKMGSKIRFTSKPGEGATFNFDIVVPIEEGEQAGLARLGAAEQSPISEAGFSKQSTADSGGQNLSGNQKGQVIEQFVANGASVDVGQNPHLPVQDLSGRCLLIDDNASSRAIQERMLRLLGLECASYSAAQDVLSLKIAPGDFDVIIIDYTMPGMDGLETIRRLGELHGLTPEKQHFILLHSSVESASLFRQCETLGITSFLSKPVRKRALLDTLLSMNLSRTTTSAHQADVHVPASTGDEAAKTQGVICNQPDNHPACDCKSSVPRILIAEDVMMNMILLKAVLKSACPEAEIFEASDGKKAVERYTAVQPDIIFMDIQMPEMDGLDASRQIRALESSSGKRTPIVALTAGVLKEEKDHCFEAGMDEFLTKPLDARIIGTVLKKYRQE